MANRRSSETFVLHSRPLSIPPQSFPNPPSPRSSTKAIPQQRRKYATSGSSSTDNIYEEIGEPIFSQQFDSPERSRRCATSGSSSEDPVYEEAQYVKLIDEPNYYQEHDSARRGGRYGRDPESIYAEILFDDAQTDEPTDSSRSVSRPYSTGSEHIYDTLDGDTDSLTSRLSHYSPTIKVRPSGKMPPPVATKPDYLHSRNPFAKMGPPDPYVGSGAVVGLGKKTFKKFIRDLDAAFVLFYNPDEKKCCEAKVNMRQAAHITQKEKHAYAAVNCSQETELCKEEKVFTVPTMKLYARGLTVDTYTHSLLSREIRTFVEKAPIVRDVVLDKKRCTIQ